MESGDADDGFLREGLESALGSVMPDLPGPDLGDLEPPLPPADEDGLPWLSDTPGDAPAGPTAAVLFSDSVLRFIVWRVVAHRMGTTLLATVHLTTSLHVHLASVLVDAFLCSPPIMSLLSSIRISR